MRSKLPDWKTVHTIVFDFDGVFTDNRVYVDQTGNEIVCCNRSDGLAFDMVRSFALKHQWNPDIYILSRETNPVVLSRAKKLRLKCVQSSANKLDYVREYLHKNKKSASGLIYVGNDLNDLPVILFPGVFSVAPRDSHPLVLNNVNLVLDRVGGDSFVRLFIEELMGVKYMGLDDILDLL